MLNLKWNHDAVDQNVVYVHVENERVGKHTIRIRYNPISSEWEVEQKALSSGSAVSRLRVPRIGFTLQEESINGPGNSVDSRSKA